MNKPFFSIIVPVYNVEKYLPQCVESILRQTYENFEVILVDDGAKDRSGEICDEFAAKDERVSVIHKQNGGLSSARNAGIREAQGKYILFVDSDDYWSNNTMLMQLSCRLDGKEVLAVWKYCRCEEESSFCNDGEKASVKEYVLSRDYNMLIGKGILFASACYEAIPKVWFENHNLFFEEGVVSEDIEWFGRVLECTTDIAYFESVFYVYRIRQGSISNSVSVKTISDISKHIDKLVTGQQAVPKAWKSCYIGEQTANFVVVLSRSGHLHIDAKTYSRFYSFLSKAVRSRSKFISILYQFFGINKTLLLLKKVG